MSNFDLPIFGVNGLEQGSFQSPKQATMEFRDPAAELAAGMQRYDEVFSRLYPALKAAHDLRDRRKLVVQEWGVRAGELDRRVHNLQNLVNRGSLQSEDSEEGSRAERLAAAQAALRETREELFAAAEELQAAELQVEVELAKTPMGAL